VLPSRFGGSGLDYQLVEMEATDGVARLILRVSPSVGAVDESAVRETLLAELGRGSVQDQYQASIWRHVGTVQIAREVPVATRNGKVLPLQVERRSTP
jgi:hypothetical protein